MRDIISNMIQYACISSTFAFAALYIISCYNQSCYNKNWVCCNCHEICSCVFISKPVPFLWRWHLWQTAASGTCQTGICTWCITSVWVATISNNTIVACRHGIFDFKDTFGSLCSYVNSWHCDNIPFKRVNQQSPDCKVHDANMGPIWGRQEPGGPHVGPMNFAIRVV